MNNSSLFFSIIIAVIVGQSYGLYEIDNSSEIVPTISDDDIYKCVSYTAAHIDISHSINEDFSQYKDCQTPGLYTLNRRDQRFKVDLDIQRQWIIQISAIIFNGTNQPICGMNSFDFFLRPTDGCAKSGINVTITETDRFDVLSFYYDMENLTIITTHNKQGEPLHFNINIWQTRSNIPDSYGLCTSSTCSSNINRNLLPDHQRSTYPIEIIQLICDIYIDNYLNSTEHQPWERSLHYNSTINNVRKACQSDVEQTDLPHAAAGSIEVLFVEDQVNSGNIISMADIQNNFQTNLEAKLLQFAETLNLSRAEVDEMIEKLISTNDTTTHTSTLTTTSTSSQISTTRSSTNSPNNNSLYITIGASMGGACLLVALVVSVYCCSTKTDPEDRRRKKVVDNSIYMDEIKY